MKCLFVIDVQNGFVSDKTRHILPKIDQLINEFNEGFIIATQFINAENSGFTNILHWNRLKAVPEINLVPSVQEKATYIIQKKTYTAYTEEVKQLLLRNNVTEAYIAGIDTDCCVLTTAITLFEHNIRPIVLEQYCASNGGNVSHQAAVTVLERTIGKDQIMFEYYTRP